ncbi:MAG TPA: IS21 family transposase, partial [Clostridiales bacterium]|nr:IS21 family transposase [Clostridiales bacterium]
AEQMAAGVFNANRLYHELKAQGYAGGKTILKDYLRPNRPPRLPRVVVRFEPAPAEQAQVDWGEFSYMDTTGRRRRVHGFVMVLSYSRAMYVEFVEQQDLSTLLRCHLNAFAALGGVPRTILYDNMKTVVLRREGSRVEYHPRLLDFALLAGYHPRACRPYRAQTKGRVERAIGYLRQHFWPAARFTNLTDLNQAVSAWVAGVAHQRVHGTTGRKPAEMLAEERQHLPPLRPQGIFAPLLCEERPVGRDGFVAYGGSRYAVPWQYSGRYVAVHATQTTVEIREGEHCLARHPRALVPGMTLSITGQYDGAPLQGPGRPRQALALQVAGPQVERRSLGVYESLLAGGDR